MIQPIKNNVLIRPLPSENVSEGGIFVPESFEVRNQKAEVVAVGNGSKARPMAYKSGDLIYNIKDCGDEILIDGIRHFIIQDTYILMYEN